MLAASCQESVNYCGKDVVINWYSNGSQRVEAGNIFL